LQAVADLVADAEEKYGDYGFGFKVVGLTSSPRLQDI
jgi:hypothetical protein